MLMKREMNLFIKISFLSNKKGEIDLTLIDPITRTILL